MFCVGNGAPMPHRKFSSENDLPKRAGVRKRGKMSPRFTLLTAFALVCSAGSPTYADCQTTVFDRSGAWRAFGGKCDDGRQKCGVSTSGTGKYFSLDYFNGDNTLTVQLGAQDWQVKNGVRTSVTMQVDDGSPWRAVGTGMHFSDGDAGLWFEIDRNQLGRFLDEFRGGDELVLRFPDSDVSDWRASLSGSGRVSESFLRCIRAMTG
jgi:hypothetical protein